MEQSELLRCVIGSFEKLGIPYLITGAVAAIAYGEPRLTNDIDVVAKVEESDISRLKSGFPQGEFYFDEEAAKEAVCQRRQFNIIHPDSGLKIDIIISKKDAFDQSRFRRARRLIPLENTPANFASPEDVILMKLVFYKEGGSEKHLRDIAGILKISGDMLDFSYIAAWVDRLDVADIWAAVPKPSSKTT
jgi:hypothetical protein